MKTFLTFTALLFSSLVFAQKVTIIKPDANDTIYLKLKKNNDGNMPNALTGFNFKQQYSSNNGMGFDIYKAEPDNMPVLKPDANNITDIPNNILNRNNKITLGQLEYLKRKIDSAKAMPSKPYRFKLIPPVKDSLQFLQP